MSKPIPRGNPRVVVAYLRASKNEQRLSLGRLGAAAETPRRGRVEQAAIAASESLFAALGDVPRRLEQDGSRLPPGGHLPIPAPLLPPNNARARHSCPTSASLKFC